MFRKSVLRRWFASRAAVTFAGVLATANAHAALSTISSITLYPGGATVERQVQIPAGSSRIEVTCLPASFDPQSLRLVASPNVQLGDFRIEDLAASDTQANERCQTTASDKRVRALQAQLAQLNARAQAVELSAQYLKNASEQTTGAGASASMSAVSRALENSGLAVYAQRDQIRQQQADVQRQLDALTGGAADPLPMRTVRIALDAPRGGTLTLAYDTPRAGWIPAYQANLDTSSGQVTLERRALVAQATGEDWHDVRLQLTTATPIQNTRSPMPREWRLDLLPPPQSMSAGASRTPLPPAPAPVLPPMSSINRNGANAPLFAPTQIESTFLTAFDIPGKIDVPADAQKVGFTLTRKSMPVKLVARVIPAQSTRAWLVAMASQPDGVWPDGSVQLRRDGAQVGETRWTDVLGENGLLIPFGPDDQVATSKADGADATGTVKTAGGDVSKTLSVRYTVRNRHRTSMDVEIVESAPVSDSGDIKVTSNYTPKPDDAAWQGHQGVVAWTRTLAAGEEVGVGASYTVRYPGSRTILGLP